MSPPMARHRDTPPKYDRVIVEAVLYELAAELHPRCVSEEELVGRVITDADDEREVETARQAIGGLAEYGLATARPGRRIELTAPALRAFALLKKTGANR